MSDGAPHVMGAGGGGRERGKYMRRLEEKGFEITTKDLLRELGDDFRKTLSELGFEKAVKGYEKIRDAEWERVLKQDSLYP